MSIKLSYIAPLLAAGAAAVVIASAPTALAMVPAACNTGIPGTTCVTPGNAQLNDSLAPNFESQYPDFALFGLGRVGGHR